MNGSPHSGLFVKIKYGVGGHLGFSFYFRFLFALNWDIVIHLQFEFGENRLKNGPVTDFKSVEFFPHYKDLAFWELEICGFWGKWW